MNKLSTIVLIICVVFLCSCKKTYKYVEIVESKSIFGATETEKKDPVLITAKDDTSAYVEAYNNFCISIKVASYMANEKHIKDVPVPKDFKLLNSKEEDISSSVTFPNKAEREKQILNHVMSMKLPN